MIIYFADRKMNILGLASTNLPEGLRVEDDEKVEETDTGIATFECWLPYTKEDREKVAAYADVGNYILRKCGDETEFYTIIDSESDTKKASHYAYAEDAGLDLLNEVVGAYEADKAYPIAFYINKFAYDSGFEIGLNEISNLTRKLKWDGDATATERIASVATQFDNAEISYDFEIRNFRIVHKYINIHKKRGKAIDEELRLDRDVDRIITKKSIASLATGLEVTGGTPEGKNAPITLSGYKYDDGDFYVSSTRVYSKKALEKWSRYQWETGDNVGHIVRKYSYDTTSQAELFSHALSELKKRCDMEVNYEVDIAKLPKNTKIGDTVNIVDSEGKLYLSARILKLSTSVSNDVHTATLGEYLIKDSGVAQRVEELAEQFRTIAKNRTLYTWIAYADDENGTGASLSPEGKKYIALLPNQTTQDVDLSDPTIFDWVQAKGDPGEKGDPGAQGEDGKITYFHVKYSPVENPTAEQMTNTPDIYIGTYADFQKEDSEEPDDYTWYRFQGLQGPQGDRGIPGKNGIDGNTSYLHIKYSNDGGITFSGSAGEEPGAWIGQYVDFYQPDSSDVTKYTWKKIEGNSGAQGSQGINLQLGSKEWKSTAFWNKGDAAIANGELSVPLESSIVETHFLSVKTGEVYTVSIDIKSTASYSGHTILIEFFDDTDSRISYIWVDRDVTSEWQKIVETITIKDSGITKMRIGLRSSSGYINTYRLLKIEVGEVQTPVWTPAIEDLQGKDAAIISSTEPSDKTYMWCDISQEPAVLKRWNSEAAQWDIVNDDASKITQIYSDISKAVNDASDNILSEVKETVYKKEDIDQKLGEISTSMEQTQNSFNFKFKSFQTYLQELASSTDDKFEETHKYIRFIDGAIYIGIEGNPIMLKEANDRISFIENNVEVAYISNRTMYFTHAEVLKDLKIGRFAWVYMDSGYLPLKLVQ